METTEQRSFWWCLFGVVILDSKCLSKVLKVSNCYRRPILCRDVWLLLGLSLFFFRNGIEFNSSKSISEFSVLNGCTCNKD